MLRLCGSDDSHRRFQKICNGGAFAHELRVHTDAEIFSELLARGFFQSRDHDGLGSAGQHRAPDYDQVKCFLLLKNRSNLAADWLNVSQVELAVSQTRRAHAKK